MSRRSHGGNRSHKSGELPREVQVSKKLSWLLRHGAESEGLTLDPEGFISLADVLSNRKIRGLKPTLTEIREVVETNDKQRFTVREITTINASSSTTSPSSPATAPSSKVEWISPNPADYMIRANQGHSIKLASDSHLQPLLSPDETADPAATAAASAKKTVVHGTTRAAWVRIVNSGGLRKMGRNHVHFAAGLPPGFTATASESGTGGASADVAVLEGEGEGEGSDEQTKVISGMRNSSTILIYIDLVKAVGAGLKFWVSDNGVILCEGDKDGLIPVSVFEKVEERGKQGEEALLVRDGIVVRAAPEAWLKGKGKN